MGTDDLGGPGNSQAYAPPFSYTPLPAAQQESLRTFWQQQMEEVLQVPSDPTVFKNHQLPLARIKKIMKFDEDVRMISAEAPVLFAKACEMFILELTLRAWMHAEDNKRRTLQRNDIAAAVMKTEIFDFLVDVVPREDLHQLGRDGAGSGGEDGSPMAPPPAMQGSMHAPSMHMPPPTQGMPPMMPPGMMHPGMMPGFPPGMPALDPNLVAMYQQHFMASMAAGMWPPMPPSMGPPMPGAMPPPYGAPAAPPSQSTTSTQSED